MYRFQVERVYKGLADNLTEIVVNPDNFTSCGTEYKQGPRYLIFADLLGGSDRVMSGRCHGSKRAEDAADDLKFLEAYRTHTAKNAVYGRVLQWVTGIGRPIKREEAPVEAANVVLRSGAQRYTQQTSANGEFRFEKIPAGAYSLSAHREPYIANPTALNIAVPAVGCVEAFPKLEARASISGIVTDEHGQPAKDVRVELMRRNLLGEWYRTYQFWQQTDAQGRFHFQGLPDGDYLLGYEIWGGMPSIYSARPSRYYPGVARREQASVVHLAPMQALQNVNLVLPKPHTRRPIRVKVVWPDGTAAGNNLLQVLTGNELIKNVGESFGGRPAPRHNGVVEFTGYRQREYNLHAIYWIDDLGGSVSHDQQRIARSETVRVEPGQYPVTVKLVLTRTSMRDDDR